MGRLGIAFRLFFRALKDAAFAERGAKLLEGAPLPEPGKATVGAPAVSVPTPVPARSEALTLLALLQREARLIDFLKENIAPYSDAQVGAAVRDVHRDAAAAIDRLFALRPVMSEAEGSQVQVPAGAEASRVRLTGNVTGQPPFRGALRHQGWEATQSQLPQWSGSPQSAQIVAPAEVELGDA